MEGWRGVGGLPGVDRDAGGKGDLRYQGQFGRYAEEAVAAVLAGKEVEVQRTAAFGCTRKRGRR
ncbi:MAG: hypothetical protein JNK87_09645 [Bryobacterales bacterium]|nr:hypothetical protein [Bryobacterales bacterium]